LDVNETHVEEGCKEPEEEDESSNDVGLGPPGSSERRSNVCDLLEGKHLFRKKVRTLALEYLPEPNQR